MEKKELESKIKREIFATLWSETDNLHIEYVFELIEKLENKAREEVLIELKDELLEQIEKGRKYEIYGGVADYQDALHLVGNMLSKLTTK